MVRAVNCEGRFCVKILLKSQCVFVEYTEGFQLRRTVKIPLHGMEWENEHPFMLSRGRFEAVYLSTTRSYTDIWIQLTVEMFVRK